MRPTRQAQRCLLHVTMRRFGRVTVRLALDNFKEAIDDLARYVLGVDDDFSKLATLA